MPLLIDYKEGDRLIINGAVIENIGSNTKILVHNRAAILRGKEVLSDEESETPASRTYFALQCAYIFPEKADEYLAKHNKFLSEYVAACPSALPIAETIRKETETGALYKGLKEAQKLIHHENEVLSSLRTQLEDIDENVPEPEDMPGDQDTPAG